MKPALTKPAARQTRWLLAVQTATACAAVAMLAAYGGNSNNNNTPPGGVTLQVVSFGDSLSDGGTYAPVATANFGDGRFTTNPGQVRTQNVAQYYGGTLTAANTSGFASRFRRPAVWFTHRAVHA